MTVPGPPLRTPPPAFTLARTCYDHLAGKLGVAIAHSLTARGLLIPDERALTLSAEGWRFLDSIDVAVAIPRTKRRFAFACTDYTERQPHIAGALVASLAATFFRSGWVQRLDETRTFEVTERGRTAIHHHFAGDS